MAAKRTPAPWRICPDPQFSSEVESADGSLSIALAHAKGHDLLPSTCEAPEDDVSDANAAFIVRAVNAHDDLVAALKQCKSELASLHHGDCDMEHAEKYCYGLRLANAILGKLEAL